LKTASPRSQFIFISASVENKITTTAKNICLACLWYFTSLQQTHLMLL